MEFKIQPWAHQRDAIRKAAQLPDFALFFEPGTGKTLTAINIIRKKCNIQKSQLKCLVFCPPIVINNWKEEWLKNSNLKPDTVTGLYGAGKARNKLFFEKAIGQPGISQVFITNYETLNMPGMLELFQDWAPNHVIFDEAHRLKDYKSKRSIQAERLVNHKMRLEASKYPNKLVGPRPNVYILTGSPVLNSPMDLFWPYRILDGGETFGMKFFAFRGKYFVDKNAGMNRQNYFPNWVLRQGALEEISEAIKHNSMRVLKKDCLDLPPLLEKTIEVPMNPKQAKVYEQMRKDFIAFFDGKTQKETTAVATLAITKGLRLMQIASGFVKDVEGNEQDLVNKPGEWTSKQDALYELVTELAPHHKIIIWAVWSRNYVHIRQVLEKAGLKWLEANGEQGPGKNMANAKEFESDPSIRVFLGHPESSGEGINLVSASYSIVYSRTFSLRQEIQAEARNYRGGSEIHEKITRINLVTENTVEKEITKRLANKEAISELVLRQITLPKNQ